MRPATQSPWRLLFLASACLLLSGCATLMSSAASGLADNLSSAVLNLDDPETARAALPSYMVLLDGMLEGNPDDVALLTASAKMYASYGAVFADDPARASRLTTRARKYASLAMCESYKPSCGWGDATYDEFVETLDGISKKHAEPLYAYGFASLAYLQAHSSDWNSLAELPQIEALFYRYLELSDMQPEPAVYTYMGILLTLRPPALGGKPEDARVFFERAIAETGGRDLSAKVEYAQGYARLLYERELHDRLLNEVIAADPYADGYTLSNIMAQEKAQVLLADADNYF
jgi:hypothetical protein